jgi:hypothetical protein
MIETRNRGKETAEQIYLTEVKLFDHTGEVSLSLWDALASSPHGWKASETVLLIYRPSLRDRGRLSVQADTYIDVNPDFGDARWLREWARKKAKGEHPNPAFPENGE